MGWVSPLQGLWRACQNPLPEDIANSFKTLQCPKILQAQSLCRGIKRE